jgi:alpha-tubulin suppressor-like RCC1 family protein
VKSWGRVLLKQPDDLDDIDADDPLQDSLRPVDVKGFEGVRMRRVCSSGYVFVAIGDKGELFLWGSGGSGVSGHGDDENLLSPKRVEALKDISVSGIAAERWHAVALAENGLVYTWGEQRWPPKPKLVKALRRVRVNGVAANDQCSYAVADTSELWAWGAGHPILRPTASRSAMEGRLVSLCPSGFRR